MMHANPLLPEKGLAFVWNPTNEPISGDFELPLYYTGLDETASIAVHQSFHERGSTANFSLDWRYRVRVPLTVPAQGHVWLLIKDAQ